MNNFDQTKIVRAVCDALRDAGVSKKVFGNRPASMSSDLADFVVCRVSGRVSDLAAFGECTLSVSLFAKDVANMVNDKKLSVMQEKVIYGLPRSIGGILIDDTPNILGDAPDGNGYHARIINYSLIIKSV